MRLIFLSMLITAAATTLRADDATRQLLVRQFDEQIRPLVTESCLPCHGTEVQEGKLDLSGYRDVPAVVANAQVWQLVLERLEAGEMPPADAEVPLSTKQRKLFIQWIKQLADDEAARNAGDPGIVLARRLNRVEYDYTIHDLTGVDIGAARELPVDPANEAGFDNSGESLSMSPALLKKYLQAARLVAEHLVLQPDGLTFAPHPVVTETDRDKYCVQRIIDFYARHNVRYADYFLASWRVRHQQDSASPAAVQRMAEQHGLSAKYLQTIYSILTSTDDHAEPLVRLRAMWHELPNDAAAESEARRGCEHIEAWLIEQRSSFVPKVEKLKAPGISQGSQPLVLYGNRQRAELRMRYVARQSSDEGEAQVDQQQDARELQARQLFCRIFPDRFFVADRAPYFDPDAEGQGRPLTAGFHLMHGYYRDDAPLYELMLGDDEQRELDRLWQELDFITDSPVRQYKDFIFFERAEPPRFMGGKEFDFARSEDHDSTSPAKMQQLAGAYLAHAQAKGASPKALEAIRYYFEHMSQDIRQVEHARQLAEPAHIEALQRFAERAYRRPLRAAERDEIQKFYGQLRDEDLTHEEALRDCVAAILLSPKFLYRFDMAVPGDQLTVPLTDYELASRLSYFLWCSMPDEELLAHAAAGDLHQPEVLLAQTRRMLRDERIGRLATELLGNWLDFRQFQQHNSVDRQRFPTFDNSLREAMFHEPIRLLTYVAREDRSVLDLLYADYTFVNAELARHYGLDAGELADQQWVRVERVGEHGRGGLLPMAVFLTNTSPGLRTSPVKRGYWVVRRLLGEHIPPPPPAVPELPQDEAELGELTLREVLERHRDNVSCAGCHQRFDSVGLLLEGYDPIGRQRQLDLAQRPVDTSAVLPDGSQAAGLSGLRDYVRQQRQDDFLDTLCRKLLAFALGRNLLLSDKQTLQQMQSRLRADEFRFQALVETIVTSPQFLHKRAAETTTGTVTAK